MTLNLVDLALHPPGHECKSGVIECSFRESVYGTLNKRDITFAEGTGTYKGALLVVNGQLSDADFRAVGRYTVSLADQSPSCYHRLVFGQHVIYPCVIEGQVNMPSFYEGLFQGVVPLMKVRDGLRV